MIGPVWYRAVMRRLSSLCLGGLLLAGAAAGAAPPAPRIVEWERGIALQPPDQPAMSMYFWFYEWNMFEAMAPGQHTSGGYGWERRIGADGASAEIRSPALHLAAKAVPGGADLLLRVTNLTGYHWPEIAGIIPCWNPGQIKGTDPTKPQPRNRDFADPGHTKTFFLSPDGLARLEAREIHFNRSLRAAVDRASTDGHFAFSHKWPTSPVNAVAGLIIRESEDGAWVTGVGWEDFLSVQGHNPWYCMHACIRVGPLAPKQSKTIRGKLYLFRGKAADCQRRFTQDFSAGR